MEKKRREEKIREEKRREVTPLEHPHPD